MKVDKVTRAQKQALLQLSSKDINAIRRNPQLVSGAKYLLVTCKKIKKRVEAIPEYASKKNVQPLTNASSHCARGRSSGRNPSGLRSATWAYWPEMPTGRVFRDD